MPRVQFPAIALALRSVFDKLRGGEEARKVGIGCEKKSRTVVTLKFISLPSTLHIRVFAVKDRLRAMWGNWRVDFILRAKIYDKVVAPNVSVKSVKIIFAHEYKK